MPDLESASRTAAAPRSTAGRSRKPPPNLPIGVLAPATMTEVVTISPRVDGCSSSSPSPFYVGPGWAPGDDGREDSLRGRHVVSTGQGGVDRVEDLVPDELVPFEQGISEPLHDVAVLVE